MFGFLSTIFSKLNFTRNIEINTKDQFLWRLAGAHEYPSDNYNYNSPYAQKYSSRLQFLKRCALKTRYQIIVIDECQDFSDSEMDVLRKLSSNIIAVGDLDQSIYESHPSVYFSTLKNFKLDTIYRYGPKIAELAQNFSGLHHQMVNQVTKVDNTSAFKIKTSGKANELDKIATLLKSKRHTDESVAILAPRRDQLQTLHKQLSDKGINTFFAESNAQMRDFNFDDRIPILITPYSAKGMEFECVILYGYDEFIRRIDNFNRVLFVSITRTSRELYLIENNSTTKLLTGLSGWVEMGESSGKTQNYEF